MGFGLFLNGPQGVVGLMDFGSLDGQCDTAKVSDLSASVFLKSVKALQEAVANQLVSASIEGGTELPAL